MGTMHNGILMKTGSIMSVQTYFMPALSLASRSMSVQRITRELREDEELRVQINSIVKLPVTQMQQTLWLYGCVVRN